MKVIIAGYNIDSDRINFSEEHQTPETISAAYARISRSPKSVNLLREEALADVAQARASNESIVFAMGHASVAEHAVFNFDIIGISRLLVETVQRTRLASFTEKSQRYVTLEGDFLVPQEIKDTELEAEYVSLINEQNDLYKVLYKKGRKYLKQNEFNGSVSELRGKAKEDARYVLALATETQFGMTINARSLERLLQRLDSIELYEAQELKRQLQEQAIHIAPSLVRYTCCEDIGKKLHLKFDKSISKDIDKQVELLHITPMAEERILAGLIFEQAGIDLQISIAELAALPEAKKTAIFSEMFENVKPWQRMPRAFELAVAEFAIILSSSSFGQLKRHRMATLLRTPYNPEFGYVIPPLLRELGAESEIDELMLKVNALYAKLETFKPGMGSYILTNANKLKVIFKANLRELYHFSRLRSDEHAQWEIKEISWQIDSILKEKLPAAAIAMMGKDQLIKLRDKI